MSFFQILFSKDGKEVLNSSAIKKIHTELQSTWKMFGMKEFNNVHILKSNVQNIPLCPVLNLTEWMSNGIWDLSYIRNFKGIDSFFLLSVNIIYIPLFSFRTVNDVLYMLYK